MGGKWGRERRIASKIDLSPSKVTVFHNVIPKNLGQIHKLFIYNFLGLWTAKCFLMPLVALDSVVIPVRVKQEVSLLADLLLLSLHFLFFLNSHVISFVKLKEFSTGLSLV